MLVRLAYVAAVVGIYFTIRYVIYRALPLNNSGDKLDRFHYIWSYVIAFPLTVLFAITVSMVGHIVNWVITGEGF